MPFLRDAWYGAAWSSELIEATPIARTLLGEPVALFRTESGSAAALLDRCPHRFAPLSRGKVKGESIECGYHGLCFSTAGACIRNPHGNGHIPSLAVVRAFPVCERHRIVWIWMGEPAEADPAGIPDFAPFDADGEFVSVFGYLHVHANYQLISDNLLDLTHGQYLHPLFSNPAGPPVMEDSPLEERRVWARFNRKSQYPNKYFQMLGFPADQLGDHRNHMRWEPPGTMLLDVGMTRVGRAPKEGLSIPTAHLLTPETETTTHYLWGMARDFRKDDQRLSDDLLRTGIDVFNNEDKPMIEAQQRAMGAETDLFKLRPALLQTDGPAIRARRMMSALVVEGTAQRARPVAGPA